MSWSVSMVGEPAGIELELVAESARQSGQCKVEFDAALPHLIGLVRENYRVESEHSQWAGTPVLSLVASGSGIEKGGTQVSRSCSVKIEQIAQRLAGS